MLPTWNLPSEFSYRNSTLAMGLQNLDCALPGTALPVHSWIDVCLFFQVDGSHLLMLQSDRHRTSEPKLCPRHESLSPPFQLPCAGGPVLGCGS